MRVIIVDSPAEVAQQGADLFLAQLSRKPDSVFGLATGSTPVELYKNLITACQSGRASFSQITTFNLDEYLGLPAEHPQSYRYFMQQQLFDHIDVRREATYVPDGNCSDPGQACEQYEQLIQQCGGIDIQLLGIGGNGHIGFNEPSSSLASRTRIKTLTEATINDNARFFQEDEFQPRLSLTMGIGTIMEARKILLIATGGSKASAVKATVEGPVSASCPASILQMHRDAVILIDQAAAGELENQDFYRFAENEQQRLDQAV